MVVAHHAHRAPPRARTAPRPYGWPIFIGVITSDERGCRLSHSEPAPRRLDHTSMNQRKRPSSAGSSRELRRRRVANNHAFPISDVRSPLDSTPIYRPTPRMYLTLRGAVVAAAGRASGPHICHARPAGPEQNRRRLALLPRAVANCHRCMHKAPEAWRLRQRRWTEVDEHAARAPRRRAPPPSARDRRDMAR